MSLRSSVRLGSGAPECSGGAEFDFFTRAISYTLAHKECPHARQEELITTLEIVGDIAGATVVEIGAGQGFLTGALVARVGSGGKVVAVDNSELQLAELHIAQPTVQCVHASSESMPLADESADVVISLANFHHIADKPRAFRECARVLKPGGRFILADVCDRTAMQRYFDEVVDRICSTGHQHHFLDQRECEALATDNRLTILRWELKAVPWRFVSAEAAGLFLQRIHDARCDPSECWREASQRLGTSHQEDGHVQLHWQLFFMLVSKPPVGRSCNQSRRNRSLG